MFGCHRSYECVSASDYDNIKEASSESLMEEQGICAYASANLPQQRVTGVNELSFSY